MQSDSQSLINCIPLSIAHPNRPRKKNPRDETRPVKLGQTRDPKSRASRKRSQGWKELDSANTFSRVTHSPRAGATTLRAPPPPSFPLSLAPAFPSPSTPPFSVSLACTPGSHFPAGARGNDTRALSLSLSAKIHPLSRSALLLRSIFRGSMALRVSTRRFPASVSPRENARAGR